MTTTNDPAKAALKPRTLTADEVTFTIECLEEDLQIEGNAMASGDDAVDQGVYDWIRGELERGNEWAWCCVKVTAAWGGFRGEDYLGGCSYRSREDFEQSNGYCADMKDRALDDLNATIGRAAVELSPLFAEATALAREIIANDLEDDPNRVEDPNEAYRLAILLLGDPRATK